MASARGYSKYLRLGGLGFLMSDLSTILGSLQVPGLASFLGAPKDHYVNLMLGADLAYNDASGVTPYWEAPFDCEIGFVEAHLVAVPAGITALTGDIRIIKDGAADASALLSGTPVTILAGEIKMTCETDSALTDAAQKWYLSKGDKIRVQVVPTGTSGTLPAQGCTFQIAIREYSG